MLADTLGRPLRFILTPGQAGDVTTSCALLEGFKAEAVLADKAYDANWLRALISQMGAEAVIPCNPTRKQPIPYDKMAYRLRNRIERCFNKLKHSRRLATRYDKTTESYLGFVLIASARLWCRHFVNTA